jgi:hypothetical protein
MNENRIIDLIAEIEDEMDQLDKLGVDIEKTRTTMNKQTAGRLDPIQMTV